MADHTVAPVAGEWLNPFPMPKLKFDATTLVLTNRQKIFWPEEDYTKGNLLDYYRDIAPVILPILQREYPDIRRSS